MSMENEKTVGCGNTQRSSEIRYSAQSVLCNNLPDSAEVVKWIVDDDFVSLATYISNIYAMAYRMECGMCNIDYFGGVRRVQLLAENFREMFSEYELKDGMMIAWNDKTMFFALEE